jgi:hypothetical protein
VFSDEIAGLPGTSSWSWSGFSPMRLPPILRTSYATTGAAVWSPAHLP